jgi:hypothetical protein
MKISLKMSLSLNLALLAGLLVLLANQHRQESSPQPVSSRMELFRQTAAPPVSPVPSNNVATHFRWDQLEAGWDYQTYIANLRAIGCPEATVEDIVRGDTARAFSWERKLLGLNGSGDGPWSQAREMHLVASLLGVQAQGTTASKPGPGDLANANSAGQMARVAVPSQDLRTESPSYPLFLQDANWTALGFSAEEQAVIAQVRQQFQGQTADLSQAPNGAANQNPNASTADDAASSPGSSDTAALTRWHKALQDADEQLRGLMGAQAYNAYQQQQYDAWYQSQVETSDASGKSLAINPGASSLK